ncbi:TraR/DksA family transcriptional regulator [Alcaligenaceae bacterium]|nr:TraR/DksA family transcriptional regulator [Alcaligenaceae bacterium]
MSTPENTLTKEQIRYFEQRFDTRKALLLDEIRQVLARSKSEHDVELLVGEGDPGDAAAESLLRGITEAEVVRDVEEVRDIVAARQRLAAGRYGLCINCGEPIRFKRLDAYPSAKRCYTCQVSHEERRSASPYTA